MNIKKFIDGLEHIYPDREPECCIWKKAIEEELLEASMREKIDLVTYKSHRCLLCSGYQTGCKDYVCKKNIKFGGNGK